MLGPGGVRCLGALACQPWACRSVVTLSSGLQQPWPAQEQQARGSNIISVIEQPCQQRSSSTWQQQSVWPMHQQPWQQQQHAGWHTQHPHIGAPRSYSWRPTRTMENPTMPSELTQLIKQSSVNHIVRPELPPLAERPMQFESRRSGVIAIKAGMMQDWDEYGARVPLTVLWIDECMVVRCKHQQTDGTTSVVLGCSSKRAKQLHPRQLGEFLAAGVPLKRKLWECKVSEDALLPPGTVIGAAHFKAGQYLDVTGFSKGKGFAGVMKRWNFAGQNATHGNTKHHRAPGSIGGRTDPGKVWKGKKMPGHLGCERITFKNIWLYKVDSARNLLYVRGQVPGPQGSFVFVRDAFRWQWQERQAAQLPFPTFLGEQLPDVAVAASDHKDPYRVYREDIGYFEADWKGD